MASPSDDAGSKPEGEDQGPKRRPRAKKEPADFADLVRYGVLTGEIRQREQRIETQSRLRRQEAYESHCRRKEMIILASVLFGLALICGGCLMVALIGQPEDKKWAMSVLASIVSAGVGFLGGKSYREKDWGD